MRQIPAAIALVVAILVTSITVSQAAPTPEQRKQIAAIQKEISAVASMIRSKEYEEAEKKLEELNSQAQKIFAEAQLPSTDRTVMAVTKLLTSNRQRVAKALDKPDPTLISFSKEIAPILQQNCGNCHAGDNPRGKLDLSSFAMMKQGGQNGPLLVPKQATRSLLMLRVATTNDQARMPRNAAALGVPVLEKLYTWINQGAIFDGEDESAPLAELGKDGSKPTAAPPVQITMATGTEKVSFVRDIAPTIVNLCTRCHSGNDPNSGLSVVTFESLMRGGDSGRVIVPGNLDGSRLWQLVGAGEQPRMPQGQARITRKFHADLKVWIEEGAKFDGEDPKTTLRQLVPTDEQLAMERLAVLSPEEFRQLREQRTEEQWKRVSARTAARFVSSEEFLVYGDASEERLKQVSEWASQYIQDLRSTFGIKDRPVWKGRLTIFVMKDRFGYTELNQVLHSRSTARDVHGHAHITAGFEDAYIALEDVGDESAETHGGLRLSVIDHITGAYLKKPGTSLPQWLIRGTGLALAGRTMGASTYINGMGAQAINALKGLEKPEDVFTDGRFGPGDVGPIGYSLVSFMIKAGGANKFGQFIARLQSGSNMAAAVKAVYPPADLANLGTAYLSSLQ
ncbi:MAG: hypothetical protein O3B13_14965 [Planctomycetota bacterium]|nr:hypothetical protein [Planctomycetota bacterium]